MTLSFEILDDCPRRKILCVLAAHTFRAREVNASFMEFDNKLRVAKAATLALECL